MSTVKLLCKLQLKNGARQYQYFGWIISWNCMPIEIKDGEMNDTVYPKFWNKIKIKKDEAGEYLLK